jgi:ribosomal protein S18 acetylase RimI-like enzyme
METRETFRERLLLFRDGAIVEPQVIDELKGDFFSDLIIFLVIQIGYITSEIWREGQTLFSLNHRMAYMHDVNGNTLCAFLFLLTLPSRPHTHFRYISSMVVHPSQRGKRLGEFYVTRLIKQVPAATLYLQLLERAQLAAR